MKIEIKVKTSPDCIDFLKLEYNNEVITIDEFATKYSKADDKFHVDRVFENAVIHYKSEKYSYDAFCNLITRFANGLSFSTIYSSKLYPKIHQIFTLDRDYYAAAQLIKSMEEQLQIGRLALIEASRIIDFNINIHWKTGYGPIYKYRTIKANNAIQSYNNLFDYLMQIVYMGFGIYKHHEAYDQSDDFEKVLKRCDYIFLSKFYGDNKTANGFKSLWRIVSKAQNISLNANKWANYLKHKGGIKYVGAEAEDPFSMRIIKKDGNGEKSDDFARISVELEDVIQELYKVHIGYVSILSDITNYMQLEDACFGNLDGKRIIPNLKKIKKVVF